MADEIQPPEKRQWTIAVKEDAMAFKPRTWQEMSDFANLICRTEFVPDAFREKPGAVLGAWQTGHEVGLPPMASLRYIAVINGRPRIWGNGFWSLIKAHPLCESTEELAEHETLEKGYGECTVKRRGDPKPVTARFTIEMAKTSGVWGGKGATQEKKEQSPWFKRPGRMLQWMARNLAGNDAIPEATIGLEITELAEEELEPRDVTPIEREPAIQLPKPKADAKPAEPEPEKKNKGGRPVGAKNKPKETADESNVQPKQDPSPPTNSDNLPPGDGARTEEAQGGDQGQAGPQAEASWTDESLPWDQRLELWIAQATDEQFEHRTDKDSFWRINFGQVKNMERAVELCGLVDRRNRA